MLIPPPALLCNRKEPMKNEEAKCTSCGRSCQKWTMFEVNTGRIQLLCSKCYMKGLGDTGKFALERIHIQRKTKMPNPK